MPHPIRFILRTLFALWLLFLLVVAVAFGDPEDLA